ncbi:hypothetical protein CFK37_16655 [Virgibacillus phasianinus]|uniref:Sporulation protein n=1 Tax=Virgibacillus phasianinus TaxID=2017483 RepID=A0A220U6S2_9BACI|nr:hypothetical protein [Virgibacillus phasianinus]ASK63672.1 hypothetical protein CFK37_16655 [Virgibacillus phasianinus]
MKMHKLIVLLILSFLVACNTNSDSAPSNDRSKTEPSKISNSSLPDQAPSRQAKSTLRKYKETTNIYAVNTDKNMLVALEVHQHDRIKLTKIKEKFASKIKKQFPKFKTEVSTDKKLVLEVKKLQNRIAKNNISDKKLKKEMDHLLKLLQEKT